MLTAFSSFVRAVLSSTALFRIRSIALWMAANDPIGLLSTAPLTLDEILFNRVMPIFRLGRVLDSMSVPGVVLLLTRRLLVVVGRSSTTREDWFAK